MFQRSEDMLLRFGRHGTHFSPAGRHVGHIQGAGEKTARISAIMLHQIDFFKARALVIPIGKGADLDL